MRLLLVEDDRTISRFLLRGLREEHHVVDLAEDADAASDLLDMQAYDLVLLDVMLPGTDGLDLCRRLRRQRVDTPILMLTARETVMDRVKGLDAGADDYLTKPFAFDELLARIRALGRRGRTKHLAAALTYGPIELDTDTHRVVAGGQDVELSATEYRLLECLMRRAETIVSRSQLVERVWGSRAEPASNVIDVYVGYLRKKLATRGIDPSVIHTVRGLGYMLKARGGSDEA